MQEKNGGNEENGDTENAKERSGARSIVSFYSKKQVEGPWPPSPLLVSKRCHDGSGSRAVE